VKKIGRYWTKWNTISFRTKCRFVHAAFTLIWIRTGLILLPFSSFRKIYDWVSGGGAKTDLPENELREIVWAVSTAANILPLELLCLPRALSAKFMLRRIRRITLEIGIEISAKNGFEAHAWVENNGEIIIGDWPDSVSYQRLWVWQ
jgi:hypothetical protein